MKSLSVQKPTESSAGGFVFDVFTMVLGCVLGSLIMYFPKYYSPLLMIFVFVITAFPLLFIIYFLYYFINKYLQKKHGGYVDKAFWWKVLSWFIALYGIAYLILAGIPGLLGDWQESCVYSREFGTYCGVSDPSYLVYRMQDLTFMIMALAPALIVRILIKPASLQRREKYFWLVALALTCIAVFFIHRTLFNLSFMEIFID